MPRDAHELLQILRYELNYIEQGGFERDHALLGTESPFQGTIACINFGDPIQAHECRECLLAEFVPAEKLTEDVPCHHIRLNATGETLAGLIKKNDQSRMVAALKEWLHATIARLEASLECEERRA
jgi:hypothetical protein